MTMQFKGTSTVFAFSPTACPSGTWGTGCLRDCNCRHSGTECNVTTGCAECPPGFSGGDCHDDIDECSGNSPCDEHATCNNTIGTFKCVCQAGYTQHNGTACRGRSLCYPKLNPGYFVYFYVVLRSRFML